MEQTIMNKAFKKYGKARYEDAIPFRLFIRVPSEADRQKIREALRRLTGFYGESATRQLCQVFNVPPQILGTLRAGMGVSSTQLHQAFLAMGAAFITGAEAFSYFQKAGRAIRNTPDIVGVGTDGKVVSFDVGGPES